MKTCLKFTFTIAIACLFAIQANAQNTKPVADQNQQQVNANNSFVPGTFVDKDNNGVCDNFKSRGNVGKGRNFVDKNGDGICDNRASKVGKGWGKGNNCQYANGNGHKGNRGRGNGCCRRNSNY